MASTPPDAKILVESFHTCKTKMSSPKSHMKKFRMTPARISILQGKSPFRDSIGSARRLFSSKRKQRSHNSTQNGTFTRAPGESSNFSPDSLEAIRCSHVQLTSSIIRTPSPTIATDLSTFMSEEKAAEMSSKLNDHTNTRSTVKAAKEGANSASSEIKSDQDAKTDIKEETKANVKDVAKATAKDAKSTAKNTKNANDIKIARATRNAKDTMKAPEMKKPIEPKKALDTNNRKVVISRRANFSLTSGTSRLNSTLRRALVVPSFRMNAQPYKSTAELEREFESTLRSRVCRG